MAKACKYDGCRLNQLGGGYCPRHQWCRTDGKAPKPLIKSTKPLKKCKIRQVAPKRAKQLRKYSKGRKRYLEKNRVCYAYVIGHPAQGCTGEATEFNHGRGRENERLLNFEDGNGLCHWCHTFYTEHSKEAIELGILKSKHKKKTV